MTKSALLDSIENEPAGINMFSRRSRGDLDVQFAQAREKGCGRPRCIADDSDGLELVNKLGDAVHNPSCPASVFDYLNMLPPVWTQSTSSDSRARTVRRDVEGEADGIKRSRVFIRKSIPNIEIEDGGGGIKAGPISDSKTLDREGSSIHRALLIGDVLRSDPNTKTGIRLAPNPDVDCRLLVNFVWRFILR